jgi:hypothetical protein
MANTQPARLSFTVQDELGTEASIAEYAMVDPAMTVTQLAGAWQGQATLLDAILDARILRGSAVLLNAMAGGKGAPAAGSRVEQTGVFNFTNAITAHRFGIAVAGLADSVIVGGRIDVAEDGPVDLWADSLVAAITGGGVYTNTAQQSLAVLVDAFLSFRKRGGLARRSRELITT